MDIQNFYDGDQRRRDGEDLSYGLDWSDAARPDQLFDLYWNSGTEELYLMSKPARIAIERASIADAASLGTGLIELAAGLKELAIDAEVIEHRIVGVAENLIHPGHIEAKTGHRPPGAARGEPEDALTKQLEVEILGTIPDEGSVDAVLAGWKEAMDHPDSLSWLRSRLAEKEVHV